MLKFLIDESSGKKLHKFLVEKGYDAEFVTDLMGGVSDQEILGYCEKKGRILVTNDKDFGELIFRLNRPASGVILLRLKVDYPASRQKFVLNLIKNFPDRLKTSFSVVTEGKVRIRRIND